MFKGLILAVIVLVMGDLVLNDGRITHVARGRMIHYAAASSDAVNHSIFNK